MIRSGKRVKPNEDDVCVECGKKDFIDKSKDVEANYYFSQTKRNSTVFIHKKCVEQLKKGGD